MFEAFEISKIPVIFETVKNKTILVKFEALEISKIPVIFETFKNKKILVKFEAFEAQPRKYPGSKNLYQIFFLFSWKLK